MVPTGFVSGVSDTVDTPDTPETADTADTVENLAMDPPIRPVFLFAL